MNDYINLGSLWRGIAMCFVVLAITFLITGCGSIPGQANKSWLQMPTGTDWGGVKLVDQRLVQCERPVVEAGAVIATESYACGCETRIINAKDDESVKITASATLEGGLPGCPDQVTAEFGRSKATEAITAAGAVATEAHGQVGDNVGAVGTAVGNIIKEAAGL